MIHYAHKCHPGVTLNGNLWWRVVGLLIQVKDHHLLKFLRNWGRCLLQSMWSSAVIGTSLVQFEAIRLHAYTAPKNQVLLSAMKDTCLSGNIVLSMRYHIMHPFSYIAYIQRFLLMMSYYKPLQYSEEYATPRTMQ